MLKRLLVYGLLLVAFGLKAQNLVPNPSFEEYYQLPITSGQIQYCKEWFSATGGGASPDYFSSLSGSSSTNIPSNPCGYENAKDGNFYAGIFTYQKKFLFSTEYIECKLKQPLLGKRYCIEFYVSLADSASMFTVNNIGLYFSPDSIFIDTLRRLTEFTPQFVNTNNPLTNKVGWTKISGTFLAQGGEQYMVLGNFNTPAMDDTVRVTGYAEYWGPSTTGYLFVDSVSVTLCDGTSLNESPAPAIAIYPNPATNSVSISMPTNYPNPQLYIYNLTGQLVATKPVQPNQPVPIKELSAGIYIFAIHSNNTLIGREKVVVY